MSSVAVWNGEIQLPDGDIITDIILSSHNTIPLPLAYPSRTIFLSQVEVARIPLHIAVGPILEVSTTCTETEDWFSTLLTTNDDYPGDIAGVPWWQLGISQSPVGVLVGLDAGVDQLNTCQVTEILFFSTNSSVLDLASFPTPPRSSDSLQRDRTDGQPVLRVHALPLSSHLLHRPAVSIKQIQALKSSAQFLPDEVQSPLTTSASNLKRKELDEIFDDAAAERRKKKQRKPSVAGVEEYGNAGVGLHHRRVSSLETLKQRPRTASENPSIVTDFTTDTSKDQRPGSAFTVRPISGRDTANVSGEDNNLEAKNRDAISRIVMANMRMFGLQQRKKTRKSRQNSVILDPNQNEAIGLEKEKADAVNDEEYKMVYHNTFKSTIFAFRNHITSDPLHSQPSRIRDTVDKLLGIFCSDSTATCFPPAITPSKIAAQSTSSNNPIETPIKGKAGSVTTESVVVTGPRPTLTQADNLFADEELG